MRLVAVLAGLCCAFFTFYTVRLLAVTKLLAATRAGGQGAYVGAVVFPLLALLFVWAAVKAWRLGSLRA